MPLKTTQSVHGGRLAVFVVLTILLGGAFIGIAIGLWAIVFSLGAAGIACAVCGVGGFVPSIIMLFDSVPVALVQFGVCLAVIAIGIILIILTVKLTVLGFKITKKMFRGLSKWLTKKKVAYEN